MKKSTSPCKFACAIPRNILMLAALSQLLTAHLHADGPVSPPLLEFAAGLPGKQVRLSWASEAGVRYRIERSTTLGVWSQIALVEASGTSSVWRDPESTTQQAFYRVMQPQPEVFEITPPLLPVSGGELRFRGQGLPPGARVVLTIDGVARAPVDLDPLGGGVWSAIIGGALPGGAIISATVVDGSGATLVNIEQPITVTETGLAADGPPSLPPAAPVPQQQSNPVPGIGIIVKKCPPYPKGSHGKIVGKEECDDGNLDPDDGTSSLITGILTKKGYSAYQALASEAPSIFGSDDGNPTADGDALIALWLSKKGYDYYKAKSDMSAAGMQSNPYFVESNTSGTMPSSHSSRPAPSGLPGEVSFQVCDLALPCPAGPQLAWIRTYRSMKPVSSGHGPQWDFSYNIRIEPLPSSAGATAPRLVLHGGGGRSDILYCQADGTYRCDGMFREGSFDGSVFTLTFADKGKWTFNPLDGSPSAGKISAITDRFGVTLSCSYDSAGRLQSVSDSFSPPRSLTVSWGPDGAISSVADNSGRSVTYSQYAAGESGGSEGDLKQVAPPGFGATVYTYSSGNTDDALNHNLLEIRDGENRLLEGFGYSADASGVSYDTCTSHDRHLLATGHITLIKREMLPPGATPRGGYAVYETDEIGRVSATVFDAQHREVRVREYTGYWEPGTAVGSADLGSPAIPKTRSSDPDFYETSASFNADHLCTQLTRPDGSQLRVTYDRDFRPGCAVRERGNARVLTIRAVSGEERTVTCEYLPGFGTPEPFSRPGNPIKGITVKGGRNPSPGIFDRPGNPIGGLTIKGGQNPKRGDSSLVWSPRSNFLDDDSDGDGWAARGGGRKGWDGTIKGNMKKEEGGRHTPFHNPYRPQFAGKERGITINTSHVEYATGLIRGDEECDDNNIDPDDGCARTKYKGWDGTIKGVRACDGFVTRMINAYGQDLTWGYNENGACTSAVITSLPSHGQLYQYNGRGQRTSVTVLNGPGSSFRDEMTYDVATGFLSSVIRDISDAGTGIQLTTTLVRDTLGRVTDVVDPMGSAWSYEYNSLDQCTRMQSPGPHRISVNLTYDNASRIIRRDQGHLGADGLPFSSNPSYSTYYRYDGRARLDQVADEERPVDGASATTAGALGLENFAVCDITRDAAGQIVRLSTPAACRAQSTDLACDFAYDERGMLFRCMSGGTASTNPVTLQCDYHPDGSLARRALVGSGVPDSAETYGYDGFHRLTSITDALGVMTSLSYDNTGFTDVSLYSSPDPGTGTGQLMSHWRMRSRPEMLRTSPTHQGGDDHVDTNPYNRDNFFDYLTEDDICIADRFTPGSADGSVARETTIVDRSPAGLVQSVTRNGDLLVTNEYDSAGRVIRCSNGACRSELQRDGRDDVVVCGRTDHFRGAGAPPSETFTVDIDRDSLGRVTQRTDGVGNVWTAAYDSFGRCVSSAAPGRPPVLYAYDGSSAAGPFAQQTSCDVAGTGTPVVLGSLLVRCGELKSSTDSYGHSTVMSYDGLGRLSACDYPDGTSETTTYNSLEFVSGRSYRDGTSITIACDALGRVTEMGWPGNPATYQYDALGRCTEATQASSTVAFTYDSLGNPVSETQTGVASAPQLISRSFDHRGRTSITYPGGASFLETRDEFGNLRSVSVAGAPPVVAMDYVGQRVWRTTQANGVVTECNYRSDGETSPAGVDDMSFDACVRKTTSTSDKVIICHGTASRAPDQSVNRIEEYFSSENDAPGRIKTLTRDNLGRVMACLTQVRATAGGAVATESEVTYTLDLEGRRLAAVGGSNPGSYTQEDALPPGDRQAGQYTTWPGGPLTWDDAGNLLTLQKGTSALSFVYDVQGRLMACNQPGGAGLPLTPVAEFSYDALGRVMIHKIHRGGELPSIDETRYVYEGGVCIQELASSGDVSTSFACADGVQQSFANSGQQYFINRGLQHWGDRGVCPGGSRMWPTPGYAVSLVTNGNGLPTERFDFDDACKPIFLDASGAVRSGASSAVGPIKWMSPESLWVPETGMFHSTGGVYSPDLGTMVAKEKKKEVGANGEGKKEYVGHVTLMK